MIKKHPLTNSFGCADEEIVDSLAQTISRRGDLLMPNKKQSGFSLVELMVVVAIIGILTSLLFAKQKR